MASHSRLARCRPQELRWCCISLCVLGMAATGSGQPTVSRVTTLAELDQLARARPQEVHTIHLEGNVWWASTEGDRLVLSDATRAEELEIDLQGRRPMPGQRVRVEGVGTIMRVGGRLQLGPAGAVVDNDGEHPMSEKSGGVFLQQGRTELRVEWFNLLEGSGLEVEFEGPGLHRQSIPSSMLATRGADGGELQPGLFYQCYTGVWNTLPAFDELTPLSTGMISNFNLSVAPQTQNVAMAFTGELEIPRTGFYEFHLRSDDGSRLFVGEPTFTLTVIGEHLLPLPTQFALGQSWPSSRPGAWGSLDGRVERIDRSTGSTLIELSAGAARAQAILSDDSLAERVLEGNQRVRATGFCQPVMTPAGDWVLGRILVPHLQFIEPIAGTEGGQPGSEDSAGPGELTTAVEVHRLRREEAEQGHPVRIRGVVTSVLPEHQSFTLQDSTRGLYVEDHSAYRSRSPQVGEFLAVEGTTDPSLFAPIVKASRVHSLGRGLMPDPVQPTWDQLMNGSLDAQFVTVEGIVTAARQEEISLLTRAGVIEVELRGPGLSESTLLNLVNALVVIRGCLFASWDYVTHQVQLGRVRIYDASVTVKNPPPVDLFDSPARTIDELMQFDPQAGAFQRVRVAGQVLHVRGAEHFLMGRQRGLRFQLRHPGGFLPGDEVEVVGFPELFGDASPSLREAVARKTGRKPLPSPTLLSMDEAIDARHDSTRVRVEGVLAGTRRDSSGLVLEIQSGVRSFAARLGNEGDSLADLPEGSRLELTGVYASPLSPRHPEGSISGFNLLVNSPADVRVLAKPPWWTLKRLAVVVAVLLFGLAVTMLWITQLRRQVEQRTVELTAQVEKRERLEYERAIDQERTRIAQDLHDELGSGITEISMLAARAKASKPSETRWHTYLDGVWGKAREMVTSLEEIVWAMDPHHDSIDSLVSYCSLYADRFLGLAGIAWRLGGAYDGAGPRVDSHQRYQVFLVFKEALNNVVRHAGASRVQLKVKTGLNKITLEITDDGRGLPRTRPDDSVTGLSGMKDRMERIGGACDVTSEPGHGTTIRLTLPSKQPS